MTTPPTPTLAQGFEQPFVVQEPDGRFVVRLHTAPGSRLNGTWDNKDAAYDAMRRYRRYEAACAAAAEYCLFDTASVDGGWYRLALEWADPATRQWLREAGFQDREMGMLVGGKFRPFRRPQDFADVVPVEPAESTTA
ncbi:MAG TPA: hypothetical protein VF158_10375 [Longimicrobiales bacterium]